jgi:hypothetical protein
MAESIRVCERVMCRKTATQKVRWISIRLCDVEDEAMNNIYRRHSREPNDLAQSTRLFASASESGTDQRLFIDRVSVAEPEYETRKRSNPRSRVFLTC